MFLKLDKHAGYTLIELAIVISIVTVILLGAVRFAIPLIETANTLETKEKMNKLSEAIALYALTNNRIPCPAIPIETTTNPFVGGFGFEQNNGTAIPDGASRCGSTPAAWRGIVPFRTLGISRELIRDSRGNYFTYAITPAFALPPAASMTSVHARCRTREWMYMTSQTPSYRSRNVAKSGFCCAGDTIAGLDVSTNLVVLDSAGADVIFRSRNRPMTGAGEVSSADAPYQDMLNPTTYIPVEQTPVGVAYILISHGKNGDGVAFGSANTRAVVPPVTRPCEEENADDNAGDRTYRDCLLSEDTGAIEENDDVVLWQTQDMIMASENQSCATP